MSLAVYGKRMQDVKKNVFITEAGGTGIRDAWNLLYEHECKLLSYFLKSSLRTIYFRPLDGAFFTGFL